MGWVWVCAKSAATKNVRSRMVVGIGRQFPLWHRRVLVRGQSVKDTFKGHLEYREVESLTRGIDDAKSPGGCFPGMARNARTSLRRAACLTAPNRVMASATASVERSDRFWTCQRSISILKST